MGRIERELKKLSRRERNIAKSIIERIVAEETEGMDIKKLKGAPSVFRVRKGVIRVIYQMRNGEPFILRIDRRRDTTYNDL